MMRVPVRPPVRPPGSRIILVWIGAGCLLLISLVCIAQLLPGAFQSAGEALGMLPTRTSVVRPSPTPRPAPPVSAGPTSALLFPTVVPRPTLQPSRTTPLSPEQAQTMTALVELELTAMAAQATPTALPPTEPPPTPPTQPADLPTPPPVQPPPVLPVPPAAPTATPAPVLVPSPEVPTATPEIPTIPANIPVPNPSIPLAAPSLNNCQPDPNSVAVPNYPIRIYTVNKETEVFILENVSPQPVDIRGWIMCSIKGNERYEVQSGVGVIMAPNEMRGFVYRNAAIWANNEPDDGALYNPQGQLVSYWSDPNILPPPKQRGAP